MKKAEYRHWVHQIGHFFLKGSDAPIIPHQEPIIRHQWGPQPPYSPDVAPSDFFLFPRLKKTLKGKLAYASALMQEELSLKNIDHLYRSVQ